MSNDAISGAGLCRSQGSLTPIVPEECATHVMVMVQQGSSDEEDGGCTCASGIDSLKLSIFSV